MSGEKKQKTISVGVLGATGMVGQNYVKLLSYHPWFKVTCLAASSMSAGLSYKQALKNRVSYKDYFPERITRLKLYDVAKDRDEIAKNVSLVFSAFSANKEKVKAIEDSYADADVSLISNNSAHRWTEDVPMIIPEINPHHTELINIQKIIRNRKKGFIAVKPNCSIQSYVPVLEAMKNLSPEKVIVSTYQAVSGAGKSLKTWPEMEDNIIPYIPNEEEKSEKEPLKIWGKIEGEKIVPADKPLISSTCVRVPVSDGHMASVHVLFKSMPRRQDILDAINGFSNPIADLELPSSSNTFIQYFNENDRPQAAIDRLLGNGMGIAVGRLREDPVLHWKFVSLSHNTIRGAAGGAILLAELLTKKGYIL